ncbi:MAG: ankyrin repeat domain-containing protein, partial [Deltaproteobacteria bacterium]|nr:ankyrin repeat domain-containing protein [Deltaproteobacteria bacterium]
DYGKVEEALAKGANIEATGYYGRKALHFAANRGYLDIVRLLLNKGAKPNSLDEGSVTALIGAIDKDHLEVAKLLLEKGANPNLGIADDTYQSPAIVLASSKGLSDIVALLIQNGAVLEAYNRYDLTALDMAVERNHFNSLKILVEAGADIQRSSSFFSPLSRSIQNGSTAMSLYLISKGADINKKERVTGMTPLMRAAQGGKIEIVKALVTAGAQINTVSESGYTALICGTQWSGNFEIVSYLLENGADPNIKDEDGLTALDWAERKDFDKIVKLLK